jgi:hypothetical protein
LKHDDQRKVIRSLDKEFFFIFSGEKEMTVVKISLFWWKISVCGFLFDESDTAKVYLERDFC